MKFNVEKVLNKVSEYPQVHVAQLVVADSVYDTISEADIKLLRDNFVHVYSDANEAVKERQENESEMKLNIIYNSIQEVDMVLSL